MTDTAEMGSGQFSWDLGIPGESGDGNPSSILDVEEGWFAMPNNPIDTGEGDMARPGSTFRSSTQTPADTYESSEGGSLDLVMSSLVQSDL